MIQTQTVLSPFFIYIVINSAKTHFQNVLLHCYILLLFVWCRRWFYGINAKIFDAIVNKMGVTTVMNNNSTLI